MANCQNCGSEVNGKFCTNCGTPLPDDTASSPDSGATTVIRAEDLQRMEAAGEQPQTPEPAAGQQPAPGWTQPSQEPSWAQPPPVQPSTPQDWTQGQQPGAGQQAGTGQPFGQQPGAAPNFGQQANTGQPYGQQQPGQQYPPASPGGYYGQQGMGGAGASMGGGSLDIGALMSRATEVVTGNIQAVIALAVGFAIIYEVSQLFSLVGHGLQIVAAILTAVAYAFIEAGMIFVTQDARNGQTPNIGDIFSRITAVWLRLIGAVVVAGILIIVGTILLVIPGLFAFIALVFVPQSVVLDGAPVFGSLSESWNIVKSDFWGTAGRVIVAIVVFIVAAIVAAIVGAILSHLPIVGGLVSGFLSALLISWFMAYTTLMFFGMKERMGLPIAAGQSPVGTAF